MIIEWFVVLLAFVVYLFIGFIVSRWHIKSLIINQFKKLENINERREFKKWTAIKVDTELDDALTPVRIVIWPFYVVCQLFFWVPAVIKFFDNMLVDNIQKNLHIKEDEVQEEVKGLLK